MLYAKVLFFVFLRGNAYFWGQIAVLKNTPIDHCLGLEDPVSGQTDPNSGRLEGRIYPN
jgi:hypothetical protein